MSMNWRRKGENPSTDKYLKVPEAYEINQSPQVLTNSNQLESLK